MDGRVIRRVKSVAGSRIERFLKSELARELVEEGIIPATRLMLEKELEALGIRSESREHTWFEHRKIEFVSYAHEWVPEMLLAAAEKTLYLVKRLNKYGWDLKDASASNLVFEGTKPVFIDIASIVESSDEPYWWPKGQFERNFILPLLAYMGRGISPDKIHHFSSDGLNPVQLSELLGLKKWTSFLAIKHCSVPVLLSRFVQVDAAKIVPDHTSKVAAIVKEWQFQSLENSIARIQSDLPPPRSDWHAYANGRIHYEAEALLAKRNLVKVWLKQLAPVWVLDIGANTGEFAKIAAENGSSVLCFENDVDAARHAYKLAAQNNLKCQIILQNVASPSPAMGWRQAEKKSTDQRISGKIDCILALAILHHWLISGGIPMLEILSQLSNWTRSYLIIEYIPPTDKMFSFLSKHRRVSYESLNIEEFELSLSRYFRILDKSALSYEGRVLYKCERV